MSTDRGDYSSNSHPPVLNTKKRNSQSNLVLRNSIMTTSTAVVAANNIKLNNNNMFLQPLEDPSFLEEMQDQQMTLVMNHIDTPQSIIMHGDGAFAGMNCTTGGGDALLDDSLLNGGDDALGREIESILKD